MTAAARTGGARQPGAFAAAAVELRRLGLFPIPLGGDDGKQPRLRGFTRMRLPSVQTVERWARRWPDANLGVLTGRGEAFELTLIDVDSPDPLDHALTIARFGETPLQTMTPSGGLHLWYCADGERCANLRPFGLPVDVKGQGGLAVLPPSTRPSGDHAGKAYRFIRGSLADLARLPTIRPGSVPKRETRPEIAGRTVSRAAAAVTTGKVIPLGAVLPGYRNEKLFHDAMRHAPDCGSAIELLAVATAINADYPVPLEAAEVAKLAHHVWNDYELAGRNWIGRAARRGNGLAVAIRALQAMPDGADAAILYPVLKRAHGARDARGEAWAAAPEAMAAARVIPAWNASHHRYRRAIRLMVDCGFLLRVHTGGRRRGDPHRYRFVKGGPMRTPRLIASTPSPAINEDLRRVADAIRSGMSIRETAAALGLDKSKVLRLKKRALSETPQGQARRETPLPSHHETPRSVSPEVSHFAGDNVRVHPARAAAAPVQVIRDETAKEETEGVSPSVGCFLSFPRPDGSHHRCNAPLSPDGIYCRQHSILFPASPDEKLAAPAPLKIAGVA